MQAKPILLSLFVLWFLVGCSTNLTRSSSQSQPTDPAIFESRGDFQAAAGLLIQMAEEKSPPEQYDLLLRAADDLLKAGRIAEAEDQLDRIVSGTGEQDLYRRILLAAIQNSRFNPEAAFRQLPMSPGPGTRHDLAKRSYEVRAESYRILGKILEGVAELSKLDGILTDETERLENQKLILQQLMPLAVSSLDLLQPKPPGVVGGWMELVRQMKLNAGQPTRLQSAVTQWRSRFPSHPALPNLIDAYYGRSTASVVAGGEVTRIAVLLPESGPLAKAGDALRDGIMAAWTQEQPTLRPQLMFYDSGSFDQIWALYDQAIHDSAAVVVGPLEKDKVTQLVIPGNLPLPTLALNVVETNAPLPGNLVQFGLSPEDEARQVAEGAWNDGHRTALILSPDNEWGARVSNAFSDRWRQLGGAIEGHQRYAPDGIDFGAPIKALIGPETSAARLGGYGEFIFMVAKAGQARQIRPQLQFHGAFGIPIYATSAVYGGDPNPQRDRDLNGVRFPEIPWLVRPNPQDPLARGRLTAVLPESRGDYARLYAMGMDAFMLGSNMKRLGEQPGDTFAGLTGQLHLGAQNHIERRMEWAIVEHGIVRPVGVGDTMPPAAMETPASSPPGAAGTPAPPAPPLRQVH